MIDLSRLRTDLRRFLSTLVDRGSQLTSDTDLFASGALKSMHVLELVNHLEDSFAIAVTQRDLFSGRLRTIDAIVELIVERRVRSAS
jgi:acyl carrier protein